MRERGHPLRPGGGSVSDGPQQREWQPRFCGERQPVAPAKGWHAHLPATSSSAYAWLVPPARGGGHLPDAGPQEQPLATLATPAKQQRSCGRPPWQRPWQGIAPSTHEQLAGHGEGCGSRQPGCLRRQGDRGQARRRREGAPERPGHG